MLCLQPLKAHWVSNFVNDANILSKSSSGCLAEGFVFALFFCGLEIVLARVSSLRGSILLLSPKFDLIICSQRREWSWILQLGTRFLHKEQVVTSSESSSSVTTKGKNFKKISINMHVKEAGSCWVSSYFNHIYELIKTTVVSESEYFIYPRILSIV